MNILLALIGIAGGTAAAAALHILFRRWREHALMLFAVIGWILAVVAIVFAGLLAQAYRSMRTDRFASMAPFWGALALLLVVLLLICAGIGLVHRRKLRISWFNAFGVMMSESGTALVAALFLNAIQYSLADVLRGHSGTIRQILNSFDLARELIEFFDLALIVVLIFLELFGYLIFRQRSTTTESASPLL